MRNFLLASTVFLTACSVVNGSGTAATEIRDFTDIDGIALSTLLDAEVRVGEDLHSIEITCDDNLLEYIETEVVDGVLQIRTEPGVSIRAKTDCTAIVKVGALHELTVSGSGNADVVTGVVRDLESVTVSGSGGASIEVAEACDVALRVSGSGRLQIDQLTACDVDAGVSGSGDLTVAGVADSIDARVSGSGSLDAAALLVDRATVSVSGSGDVWVNAAVSADVRITGSGDVYLAGGAEDVDTNVTGSGAVRFED